MKFPKLFAGLGAPALLAACASGPAPAPAPAPAVARPVAQAPFIVPLPPANADWGLFPLTPGGWVYSEAGSGSQALFGPANSEARFIVRCDKARRQVVLSREGQAGQLTLRTSNLARTLTAASRAEPLPYLAATLPASDPLLDSMVFSRGRFTIEAPGLPMLVIPAWPEPARVVEDCRS